MAASQEARPLPISQPTELQLLPENGGQQLVAEVAREPIAHAEKIDSALPSTAVSQEARPPPISQPAELQLPDAGLDWPLSGDLAAAQNGRRGGLDLDDIAWVSALGS